MEIDLIGEIDGEAAYDASGVSVSLNRDGSILAIGADSGHVRVYRYDVATWAWSQLGVDIDGKFVSLSADGTILAVGAPGNDDNGERSGQVRVYRYEAASSVWSQLGGEIDGEAAYDESGRSVSLSSDGSILAVGAPGNDGNGDFSGQVRVYRYEAASSAWSQLGGDIDGKSAYDELGSSVSLSADGSILAVGAPNNVILGTGGSGNDAYSGRVRVYQYETVSSAWVQLGGDIDGEAADDFSGWSVSLSADGSILAVGTMGNDGNGANSGRVRVYRYDAASSTWVQLGGDIDGEAAGDRSGWSVSLSSDGSILAVGAIENADNGVSSGHVRVYRYEAASSKWVQLGGDIDGEAAYDHSGGSVSLSADASILAVGATGNADNGDLSGHVRVYRLPSCCEVNSDRIDQLETRVGELEEIVLSILDSGFDPTPEPLPNLLENGELESELSPWRFYTNGIGSASIVQPGYDGSVGALMMDIVSSGSNIQLYQNGIKLQPNTEYELTFVAYSNTGHDFRVSLARHNSPYTNYGLNRVVVNLGNGWQVHTLTFTTKGFSTPVSNARLYIWLASDALGGDQYFIDNVRLVPTG